MHKSHETLRTDARFVCNPSISHVRFVAYTRSKLHYTRMHFGAKVTEVMTQGNVSQNENGSCSDGAVEQKGEPRSLVEQKRAVPGTSDSADSQVFL